jgi:hypothetical protein
MLPFGLSALYRKLELGDSVRSARLVIKNPYASITGGNTAERSGTVFPVHVHAYVGRLLFFYFINSRLKAMMTMPPMRPKTLSCPLP